MRQVFFNSFKEKILKGQVPDVITASGIPFTSEFLDTYDNTDISIEQYRTLSDFDSYSEGNSATKFEDTKFKYSEYGIEYSGYYDNDVSEKPLFINPDNYQEFLQIYSGEIRYEDPYVKNKFDGYVSDDANVNSGFYYVAKKSQLKWIADRCNDDSNFNNRITVVLGDDIGNPDGSMPTVLDTVIGKNPKKPFSGIFDMNGHKLSNLIFSCQENSNGLIGYLSPDGIVRDAIVQDLTFRCMNKISLDKIRDDCSDVVAGGLVGTNYGTVENIITSGTVQFNGFCPEVYLTENKYEYESYDVTVNNRDYNCFFPSKFCINSIYNVIPYVGYFAEGADSYFNDIADPMLTLSGVLNPTNLYLSTQNNIKCLLGLKFKMYGAGDDIVDTSYNYDHYLEGKLANSILYDQSSVELAHVIPENPTYVQKSNNGDGYHPLNDNSYFADVYRQKDLGNGNVQLFPPLITTENDQRIPDKVLANTLTNLVKISSWNEKQEQDIGDATTYTQYAYLDSEYGSYLARQIRDQILMYMSRGEKVTTHQKMNPYSRIAYFGSPIVGNNFGTIRMIDCHHTIREAQDTFVGFIGNVCGKENCGDIYDVNSVLDIEVDPSSAHAERMNVYTNNLNFKPDYPEDYANLVNVFGYNWDYYQSPDGLNADELEIYSAVSASAVKVTDRFYRYHDLGTGTYSGVKEDKLSNYTFNRLDYTEHVRESNQYCNFNLTDLTEEETSATASKIPEEIRRSKLKLNIEGGNNKPDDFSVQLSIVPSAVSTYSTFKLFNPYDASKRDNVYERLNLTASDVQNGFKNISVQHLDYNQLGDACKFTSLQDQPDFGSIGDYKLTMEDVMNYCPSFTGNLGKTIDNAYDFAKNIMDAKVAIGCEMLANPELRTDYQFPGGNSPFTTDAGLFGTTNNNGPYVIPAHTGPNDSDSDYTIGRSYIADMCWYMQPGSYPADTTNGPIAYDTSVVQYLGIECESAVLNSGNTANRINYFCSIAPNGRWDLYGSKLGKFDSDTFNERDNYSKAAIPRSVLEIDVRSGAEQLTYKLAEAASSTDGWNEIIGNSRYDVAINKIYVPVANRTQNDAYQSSSFEGVNVSGIYIHEKAQKRRWKYLSDRLPAAADKEDPEQVGNLDKMYIDMSVYVKTGKDYKVYPMIAEIPVNEMYLPISCVKGTSKIGPITVDYYSEDLANTKQASNIYFRMVKYFHLIPAYDMYDTAEDEIAYRLKSIYNIGGICGMINHSQRFIEHGSYDLLRNGYSSSDFVGTNRAETGSIRNCCIKVTDKTIKYINDTLLSEKVDGKLVEKNDHTIAIANKFGGVAAVYEYRQNDMGTSPSTMLQSADLDALQRIDFQKFKIDSVTVAGPDDFYTGEVVSPEEASGRDLFKTFDKVFSPLIEWCNVSNVLDTTNFFLINDERNWENLRYCTRQSSNFPIAGNIHQALGVSDWDMLNGPGSFIGQTDARVIKDAWPVIDLERAAPTPEEEANLPKILERMFNRVGSNSTGISTVVSASDKYPRLSFTKRYDLLPSILLNVNGFNLYGDIDDPDTTTFNTHMSPVANASCSEYNDIYEQTLSGNGHFINRKLSKPILTAPVALHGAYYDLAMASRVSSMPILNQRLIDFFTWRYVTSGGITDRYFTWDYDRVEVDKSPLLFTIKYKKSNWTRGLWIHQHDRADYVDKLQYPMRDDEVINDGSNVHLGYMPSTRGIVKLMNTLDLDVEDEMYDEGRSVDGEDFRGILLFDTSDGSLITLFDRGYGADLDNGSYIAELKKKARIGGIMYGLLAELKV